MLFKYYIPKNCSFNNAIAISPQWKNKVCGGGGDANTLTCWTDSLVHFSAKYTKSKQLSAALPYLGHRQSQKWNNCLDPSSHNTHSTKQSKDLSTQSRSCSLFSYWNGAHSTPTLQDKMMIHPPSLPYMACSQPSPVLDHTELYPAVWILD